MHVHTRVCIRVHMCTYMYTCMHTFLCVLFACIGCVFMCMWVHTHTHVSPCKYVCISAHVHVGVPIYVCLCVHAGACVCVHAWVLCISVCLGDEDGMGRDLACACSVTKGTCWGRLTVEMDQFLPSRTAHCPVVGKRRTLGGCRAGIGTRQDVSIGVRCGLTIGPAWPVQAGLLRGVGLTGARLPAPAPALRRCHPVPSATPTLPPAPTQAPHLVPPQPRPPAPPPCSVAAESHALAGQGA